MYILVLIPFPMRFIASFNAISILMGSTTVALAYAGIIAPTVETLTVATVGETLTVATVGETLTVATVGETTAEAAAEAAPHLSRLLR